MNAAAIVATSYVAVLAAEILGDKTLYTLGSLSARYRTAHLAFGALAAFALKMAVAVASGEALSRLPAMLVRVVGAATFFVMALALWRKPVRAPDELTEPGAPTHWTRPAAAAFGAILLSEWGDPGQITAAALAARYRTLVLVWVAATLAMATKGLLGLALGKGLRRWVPHRAARYVAVGMCLLMGLAAILE